MPTILTRIFVAVTVFRLCTGRRRTRYLVSVGRTVYLSRLIATTIYLTGRHGICVGLVRRMAVIGDEPTY